MTRLKCMCMFTFYTGIVYILYSHLNFLYLNNDQTEFLSSEVQQLKSITHKKVKDTDADAYNKINDINEEVTKTTKRILTRNTKTKKAITTILIWTRPHHDPLMYLLTGKRAFVKRKCKVQNCYITTDKSHLNNIIDYDVLLFNGPEIVNKKKPELPLRRSMRQKYVYASIESSDYYPICDNKFDGYFNISWTYKLNSDIFYGYIIVRNIEDEIIGPQKIMHWINIDEMKAINETVKQKLSTKTKLAAWLVSNCNAPSGRDNFVKKIQSELKLLGTDLTIDVYGKCGNNSCDHYKMADCMKIFERDYYFYFSFENSFADDYVTEKLLHALQHYTVPVVYGGANYSRFMPDGIYLNAIELGPKELARRMIEIVSDKEQYYNYFKLINHYSFHYVEETSETDFFCKFCEAMNDKELMTRPTVIENFKEWWNPPVIRRGGCPPRY